MALNEESFSAQMQEHEGVPVETGNVASNEDPVILVITQRQEQEAVPVATDNVALNENPVDMDPFAAIRMPPTIRKRGRPKGCDTTVIGVPKKRSKKIQQSNKSQPSASVDETCSKCRLVEPPKRASGRKKVIQWIECDRCNKWYHRCCCPKDILPKKGRGPFKCELCGCV